MALDGWITLLACVVAALLLTEAGRRLLRLRVGDRLPVLRAVVDRCSRPVLALAAVAGAQIGITGRLSPGRHAVVQHALAIALILAATWLGLAAAFAASDVALHRVERAIGVRDNRRARRVRTQLLLVRRLAGLSAAVVAIGAVLTTFSGVRALGASLLASAGIAGIIGGVSARSTLGNVFAGLQLAFSDALRIDDVVVVEDEWGRIEELTLTYVVVRTWDSRRLILPTLYFVETPFENWTRSESAVIGAVTLRVDWSVPVDELRAETYRVLQGSPLWDRREWVLQVTDVLDNGLVELRALMSAADAPSAWDLRCEVREALVGFVRERHPEALPRLRTELGRPDALPAQWRERAPV